MNKKKNRVAAITIISVMMLCVAILVTEISLHKRDVVTENNNPVTIDEEQIPLSSSKNYVKQTSADINVIPDKYNCGAKGELRSVSAGDKVNGVAFKASGDSVALEFCYSNSKVTDVVFENLDFTGKTLVMLNESKVSRNVTVKFKNCKFDRIRTAAVPGSVFYSFENCTMTSFYGSNSSFNRCLLGHYYTDCMNIFQNVSVVDSYFCDIASNDINGEGKHSDGVQMYGYKDADVKNISFKNCRFEIPAVQSLSNSARVNACLMVQLEYSNADGIVFDDCIINGGGYSIYAWSKNTSYQLNNVKFSNIKVGAAKLFGTLYPKVSADVIFSNVTDQDSLYVSSVWKDDEYIHAIASNDTNMDRKLLVKTTTGTEEFVIPKCIGGNELRYDNYDKEFSSFPFDIEIKIPVAGNNYVVCYDGTGEGTQQIRFVSFDNKPVYIEDFEEKTDVNVISESKESVIVVEKNFESDNTIVSEEKTVVEEIDEEIISRGSCGKNVTYTVSSDGELHIYGNGIINDYNSTKLPPWRVYADQIKSLVVDEGITKIGAQAFSKLMNIENVILPNSLISISSNAFNGCKGISSITFGSNISTVEKYAFAGTALNECNYAGTEDDWNNIVIGSHNDKLLSCKKTFCYSEEENPIIAEGTCGTQCKYELRENGELHIFGNGAITNYNSNKVAPWNGQIERITSVVIDEGVTSIGSQAFADAKMLSYVSIPESVDTIGNSAFLNCISLKGITLSKSINSIGKYAFAGSGISLVHYKGNEADWSRITIGTNNTKLTNSVVFEQ